MFVHACARFDSEGEMSGTERGRGRGRGEARNLSGGGSSDRSRRPGRRGRSQWGWWQEGGVA